MVSRTNPVGPRPHQGVVATGTVAGGAMAGLISGIAMALVEMSHSAATGLGFWLPMKLVAAVAVGVDSILGGGGIVILGLVLHLSVSVFLGIIFSIVTR